MNLNTENIVLLCALVVLISVFFALIAIIVSPQYLVNFLSRRPSKLYLRIREAIPAFFIPGEEMWKDIDNRIGESRRQSLTILVYRIVAILMALVTGFSIIWILFWILGLYRIF